MTGGRSRRRRWRAGGLILAVLGIASVWAADRLLPPDLHRLGDVSTVVVDRRGTPLRLFTNSEQAWRLPATVGDVAPLYIDLLIASEDRRFHAHPGVDGLAVVRAVIDNIIAGRVTSGASTLTMQVARLLEPRPRTLTAKFIETARALQLEWRFDKRRILEMYLTLAPFGGNVEGVRAAALILFGKDATRLTAGEAALLVALPQAPTRLRPDRNGEAAQSARTRVLQRAVARGIVTTTVAAEAAAEPIPRHRFALPFSAPHLAAALRRSAGGEAVIRTTVDAGLQSTVEALVDRELPTLLDRAGVAVLVVDNRTASVVCHVGAAAFFDDDRLGQIDMTNAIRSPGSALKPFIYALAFDDGVAHPRTLVEDVSTRFGEYAPKNFDQRFHGELTVREALQRSLNIPAVVVLERLGAERFVRAITRTGVGLRLPGNEPRPGLPVALGGVGMRLSDLTALYVGLARGGMVTPLAMRVDAPPSPAVRLVSPAAAATVLAILAGAPPPPGLVQATDRRVRGAVALKTGTSYGHRDAWAFGVGADYTVGVWVGRPDGSPSPEHAGRWIAAPIVYRIFDLLPDAPAPGWREADEPVPALLARLAAGDAGAATLRFADPHGLRLVFPRPGTKFEIDGAHAIPLSAAGGRRPLTWLVDGRPLPAPRTRRDAVWQPQRPGPARISVIDADGRSDAAEIVVRAAPSVIVGNEGGR